MKSVSTIEARTINGGGRFSGKVTAKCSQCKTKFTARWYLTKTSKNAATVLVNSKANNCYYSHF